MKIEQSQVTKLTLSDLHGDPFRLDPVTVFVEDFGVRATSGDHQTRAGKVTIECYGESWSTYWGSMGDRSVAQFMADESTDYVAGCLRRGIGLEPTVFSGEALANAVRRIILQCRRGRETWRYECGSLDREEARRLYDDAECLERFDTSEALMYSQDASDLLAAIFTEEWHHGVSDHAFVPNHRYEYLLRIVGAVRQGFVEAGMAKGKESKAA